MTRRETFPHSGAGVLAAVQHYSAMADEALAIALAVRLDAVEARLSALGHNMLAAQAREYAGYVRGNPGGYRSWVHWAGQLEGAATSGEHNAARRAAHVASGRMQA